MSKIYKLTEVVNFIGGSQPPKSVFSDIKKDGYVRLIQIRDYKSDNYIVYINEDSTKKFCTEDDIMIGRYGPPVFQILRGISGAYNVALMKAEPKIDEVSKEYLFRFLQNPSIQNYIIGLSQRSAGQSGVNKEALEQYEILLPSLIEQQRIVSKLDLLFEKIDKSIALHQKNMDEANAFMGSVLNDVFGELEEKYGKTKINDVVVKTNNVNPMNDLDKPFTYIDISSIDNKSFQIVEPKQLIGKEAPSRAKKEVVLGDIVYSTTRPNLKNISIVNKEYDNPIASTGFCVLRVNENTINSYLFYYLITDKLFEQIEPNIRGTQYPATSDKDLKNCNIPNTPLIIQQKVVKYLDEISQKTEKIKQVQKDKMNSLKALKASILDQAFKGEL
jgi:type I restriction enzyme, S subunit